MKKFFIKNYKKQFIQNIVFLMTIKSELKNHIVFN